MARSLGPDDLATIVYTSGTTGHIQGRDADSRQHRLQHSVLAARIQHAARPGQHFVSAALPHHGAPRGFRHALPRRDAGLLPVYGSPAGEPAGSAAQRFSWRCPASTKKSMLRRSSKPKSLPKRAIYDWALSVGQDHKPEILAGKTPTSRSWKLANKLVFSKIRAGHGRPKSRPSSPAVRRSAANWLSGTPTSASAFTKATGSPKLRQSSR